MVVTLSNGSTVSDPNLFGNYIANFDASVSVSSDAPPSSVTGVVANGGTWMDRGFAARECDLSPSASGALQANPPVFNERQRKVLRFVLEGLSNKEIAWRLQISESYVKAILQALFQKTGVRTRGQLVRVAVEQYEDQL